MKPRVLHLNVPLQPYQGRGLRNGSQPDSIASTSYDPLAVDTSLATPHKLGPSFTTRSDELSLIDHPTYSTAPPSYHKRSRPPSLLFFRWWLPEILASVLSIAAILAIAIVLRVYNGRSLENLGLPKYLTLNGLIAAIATFDRVFLIVPVGSAISQEAWLWFASNDRVAKPKSRLRDLNLSDAASRGAWGSFIFIFCTPTRYGMAISVRVSLTRKVLDHRRCLDLDSFPGHRHLYPAANCHRKSACHSELPIYESWKHPTR
jgi:Protein of unknown function (DUF3176)